MNRKDLIMRATEILKERKDKKPVSVPDHVFYITDDAGNSKPLKIKGVKKDVSYTSADTEVILDALMEAIRESLRKGEPVSIYGFGRLEIKKVLRDRYKLPDGTWHDVQRHYTPRFFFGNELKRCAEAYESSLKDAEVKENFDAIEEFDSEGKWLEAFYANEGDS